MYNLALDILCLGWWALYVVSRKCRSLSDVAVQSKTFLSHRENAQPNTSQWDFKVFLKSHLNSCTVYNYNFTNISCFDFDKMKALKIFDRKNVNTISDRFWPYSAPQVSSSAAMVLQFTISQVMMFPSHSCQFVSSNCETNN